jgi:hypothetical protein
MGLCSFAMLYLFLTVEQFGTNMRATAGTSALSAGRTTLAITGSMFLVLHNSGLSLLAATGYVSAFAFALGFISLLGLRETYRQSMDFVEAG